MLIYPFGVTIIYICLHEQPEIPGDPVFFELTWIRHYQISKLEFFCFVRKASQYCGKDINNKLVWDTNGFDRRYLLRDWLSPGRGGVEDFDCVTILKKPDTPKKLCNIVMTTSHPPWQLIGGQFSFVPTLYSVSDNWSPIRSPWSPCDSPKNPQHFIHQILLLLSVCVGNERETNVSISQKMDKFVRLA